MAISPKKNGKTLVRTKGKEKLVDHTQTSRSKRSFLPFSWIK